MENMFIRFQANIPQMMLFSPYSDPNLIETNRTGKDFPNTVKAFIVKGQWRETGKLGQTGFLLSPVSETEVVHRPAKPNSPASHLPAAQRHNNHTKPLMHFITCDEIHRDLTDYVEFTTSVKTRQ